eukprot:15447626-Alexandrium_andersonii.AAC.1
MGAPNPSATGAVPRTGGGLGTRGAVPEFSGCAARLGLRQCNGERPFTARQAERNPASQSKTAELRLVEYYMVP